MKPVDTIERVAQSHTAAESTPARDRVEDLSRRDFLRLSGTGLFIFFWTNPLAMRQEPARLSARPSYPTDFNSYLRIAADGRVTCMVGKVEL